MRDGSLGGRKDMSKGSGVGYIVGLEECKVKVAEAQEEKDAWKLEGVVNGVLADHSKIRS